VRCLHTFTTDFLCCLHTFTPDSVASVLSITPRESVTLQRRFSGMRWQVPHFFIFQNSKPLTKLAPVCGVRPKISHHHTVLLPPSSCDVTLTSRDFKL
jgi:hypothetical protein